jgi:hypothetical protein
MPVLRAMVAMLMALLVAALLAAWLVPPLLDAGQFRGEIARLASARFGRDVQIAGPIALRLLPEPTLTASDVTIASGQQGVSLTAAELRVRIAPAPLLSLHVDARELVLRGAELRLPWPPDSATLLLRTPAWLSAVSARIEDGRLVLGPVSVTGINATLVTDAYTGTYAAIGTAELSGQSWRFSARLSQAGKDGSASLDLALDGEGRRAGVSLAVAGQLASDGSLAGRIHASGPDLSRVLPAPAEAFRAEGRLTMGGGLVAADDLVVDIGGAPSRAAVALRVVPQPRLDIALTTGRLDLDAWRAVLLQPSGLGVPTSIDLSAEAATFAGGTITGLRGTVDLSDSGAEMRDVRAILPGDAMLRLSGRVNPATPAAGSQPRFEGDLSVSAPALRATLGWLQHAGLTPVAALPAGVLQSATLTGHVLADPGQVAVGNLDGSVDGNRIAGSLSLRGGSRFAVGAGLSVDRIALDPWLGAGAWPSLPELPLRFAGFDMDLRLEAKQAELRGITLSPLSLDMGAESGRLVLRKLEAQYGSVHASAAATVGPGGRITAGRLVVQSPQAAPFAAWLPERLGFLRHGAPLLWRAAASAEVLGSGPPDQLALQVTADLGDLRLEAQPTLNLAHDTWRAALTLRHPGAPRLLEAFGLTPTPAWLGDGSFALVAQASGTADRVSADNFDLNAGALHASGALAVDAIAAMPTLTGHVTAETLPLPLPMARSPDPLPLWLLAGWGGSVKLQAGHVLAGWLPVLTDAQATVTLGKGVLRIDGIAGRMSGGSFAGTASLDTSVEPPSVALRGTLSGATVTAPQFDLPLDITGGTLDVGVAVGAAGHAPAALLATLDGDVSVLAHSGTLRGVALGHADGNLSDEAVAAALGQGATWFDTLQVQAHAERGVFTLQRSGFTAEAGEATLDGLIDLPDRSADLHLVFRPAGTAAPPIGLRLTGPFDAIRRTPELAELTRWRAARADAAAVAAH